MSRREDVLSRIYVTIMDRSAYTALPSPYSKTLPAFRAGAAITHAAGLGGKRFLNFCEPHACVIALVSKHGSKRTPSSIQHRLGLSSLGEGGGIHVANKDRTAAFDQPCGQFMQEVFAAIRDLGVKRPSTGSLSRPLRAGQPRLQVTVEPLGIKWRQLGFTKGRELLQAQVNSNARHRTVKDRGDRELTSLFSRDANVQIPATATILTKVPRTQFKVTQAEAIPQRQPLAGEVHLTAPIADRSDFEWNPAQGAPGATALAPGEPNFTMLASSPCIFLGDLLHRLRRQIQTAIPARCAFEKWPEIESRQESPFPLEHFDRQVIAVVEDKIDLTRQAREPGDMPIFHPQVQHTDGSRVVAVHTYSIPAQTLQNTREIGANSQKYAVREPLFLPCMNSGVPRGETG
jgi:hypothetical protein